jgi:hypothetical protein
MQYCKASISTITVTDGGNDAEEAMNNPREREQIERAKPLGVAA